MSLKYETKTKISKIDLPVEISWIGTGIYLRVSQASSTFIVHVYFALKYRFNNIVISGLRTGHFLLWCNRWL